VLGESKKRSRPHPSTGVFHLRGGHLLPESRLCTLPQAGQISYMCFTCAKGAHTHTWTHTWTHTNTTCEQSEKKDILCVRRARPPPASQQPRLQCAALRCAAPLCVWSASAPLHTRTHTSTVRTAPCHRFTEAGQRGRDVHQGRDAAAMYITHITHSLLQGLQRYRSHVCHACTLTEDAQTKAGLTHAAIMRGACKGRVSHTIPYLFMGQMHTHCRP